MRNTTRVAIGGVLAGLILLAVAVPAEAANQPLKCGSTAGDSHFGIITSGSNYKTRQANSKNVSYLLAGVQWRPAVAGAPLNWYFGPFEKVYTTYSAGVSQTNYPAKMSAEIWYNTTINCDASLTAQNW